MTPFDERVQQSMTQAWGLLAPYGLTPQLLPVTAEVGAVPGGLLAVLRETEGCSDEEGLPTPRRITVNVDLPQLLETQDLSHQVEQILLDTLLHELGHALEGWAMDTMMDSGELLCDLDVDELKALHPAHSGEDDESIEEVFVESLALHLSGTRPATEPMSDWFAVWLRQCASDLRFVREQA